MTNIACKIYPNKMYPVNYTIKQNGDKVIGKTMVLGMDMTEKQIIEYLFKI